MLARLPPPPHTVPPYSRVARGFTLVEVLTVLTIVATTTAIALPRLNRNVRQSRVASLAGVLTADVDAAFSLASRSRRPIVIAYDAASAELRISDRNAGTIYRRRPVGASSDFRLDSASLTPSSVVIFPRGYASAAFSVFVRSGVTSRRIDVTRTGLTRIVVP